MGEGEELHEAKGSTVTRTTKEELGQIQTEGRGFGPAPSREGTGVTPSIPTSWQRPGTRLLKSHCPTHVPPAPRLPSHMLP